ncbi:MAG: hypothetical protein H8E66_18455 [Planctomycetes bacterium]|nr:hypothetical protein [Planctomycetota bacterium]
MNELNELREHARRAGDKLLEDLRYAEVTTSGWSNRERTELEVSRIMNSCLDDLALTNCWGKANRVPSNVLWKVAGEVLSVGWLQQHARQKPRGYAGDFEMIDKIVNRSLCSDSLGRAFDHFFQEQAAPYAVRFRTQLVADRIVRIVREAKGERVHICSVGCGPAIDVDLACRELTQDERAKLVVTLLDLDPDALTHARHRLESSLDASQLCIQRENLFRLPKLRKARALLEYSDFIACTGLFDYLTDADAVEMLGCFWSQLSDIGEMIVFNFAPSNPSRAYMEWIGNWYLTYRDEDNVAGLIDAAVGEQAKSQVARDEFDASVYVTCQKLESSLT